MPSISRDCGLDDPQTQKSQRGRRARRRGAEGERELANLLSDELGIPVRRMLGQERDGGADIHIGELRIQVKRAERVEMSAWWAQTLRDAPRPLVPVLAYRTSRQPWRFRLALADVLGEQHWDRASWVEMPIGSFAWWLRENDPLEPQREVVAGLPCEMEELAALRLANKRYETARRMNPRQWAEAWRRNIETGQPFDEVIDEMSELYASTSGASCG